MAAVSITGFEGTIDSEEFVKKPTFKLLESRYKFIDRTRLKELLVYESIGKVVDPLVANH